MSPALLQAARPQQAVYQQLRLGLAALSFDQGCGGLAAGHKLDRHQAR